MFFFSEPGEDKQKTDVIYITAAIAGIFFVCFIALVLWHMQETGRACFKRNDRRDTFNSQHAASARNKLRKPPPVDTSVFENRWSGKVERDREEQANKANVTTTINSVVIENVSVIAYNKRAYEDDPLTVCNETSYKEFDDGGNNRIVPSCLLYTSPSPRDQRGSRMPSSA